jgi:hypothetical protein
MMMKGIGEQCNEWYKNVFNEEFKDMEKLKFEDDGSLDYMSKSPTLFMVVNMNLANLSHYDIGDGCHTISTWTEETIGNTLNWKFVLPNVDIGDSNKGTVISLHDGVTISWDAAKIRHCSSRTSMRIRGGGNSSGTCKLRKKRRV